MTASGYVWPIIDTRLKYLRPTKYSEHILVSATLVEFLNRMKIEYVIKNRETSEPVTRGYTIQAAVLMDRQEMCFCSPNEFIEKVIACATSA
jgi:acyl-CoA thioester hydrolase